MSCLTFHPAIFLPGYILKYKAKQQEMLQSVKLYEDIKNECITFM